ncbi:acyl-CoA dehydrogenase family protein [Neomicrococcus aestuarii]|uniref:Acyl-CoA dehydrogenase n=1 Tax=Neomicrococcus aestuarii TaxID=556325 RepID=A0A1L2ZQJ9_9MICC|nr:acyl-CoA dehydrogenase family protein [Neomicrococcus aestuarii]APF41292.1 acyl-CoA dehydrogenase [Neomicrococcus aestuarii]
MSLDHTLDAPLDDSSEDTFPHGVTEPEYDLWGTFADPRDPSATMDVNTDPAGIFANVSAEDREYWARAREFGWNHVRPVIDEAWSNADYPVDLAEKLGEADLLRDGLDLAGHPKQSRSAAALVNMELSRFDGSVGTILGVQGGLALRSVVMCGSEEQHRDIVPAMANGTLLGAFALTEPTHGSDSVGLETRAVRTEGGYLISGEKKWIGNGSMAQSGHDAVSVVWARDEEGKVRGFIVDQKSEGYKATTITGKLSLRAIWQAHIRMDNVFVPDSMVLPNARSFKDTAAVLFATRLGVAWSAVGHATALYETAVRYAKQRTQFGKPLAAHQIVQERLTRMQSELVAAQLIAWQMTQLEETGQLTGAQASLAKFTCTRNARSIAQNARDLMGGNGVLIANRAARHFADIEAIHTYEGTETVQALIIGRDITGFSAFA